MNFKTWKFPQITLDPTTILSSKPPPSPSFHHRHLRCCIIPLSLVLSRCRGSKGRMLLGVRILLTSKPVCTYSRRCLQRHGKKTSNKGNIYFSRSKKMWHSANGRLSPPDNPMPAINVSHRDIIATTSDLTTLWCQCQEECGGHLGFGRCCE